METANREPGAPRARGAWEGVGLFFGPLSAMLAALLLFLQRDRFDHGPGVPSAGRTEAWDLIWLVLLIVTLGHLVSAGWLAACVAGRARSRSRWDRRLAWSAAYHLVVVPLALWVWFRR